MIPLLSLIHLQMSLESFANKDSFPNESSLIYKQAFPANFVLLYFPPQWSPSENYFPPQKKTHTMHITSHIHQTPSPKWCCLLLQRHGCGEPAIPTPGILFGREGEGSIQRFYLILLTRWEKKIIKVDNFILVFISSQFLSAPKQWNCTSPTVHTSYPFRP